MKNVQIFLLFVLFLCSCSRHSYRIHPGESYYSPSQQTNFGGSSLISAMPLDSTVSLEGVYCEREIFLDQYPVVRVYSNAMGKLSIPLTSRLECNDGTVISIKGRIVEIAIAYSLIKKRLHYKLLEPISVDVIYETDRIKKIVSSEYRKVQERIEAQIAIEGSKLKLSAKPEWDIWYTEPDGVFIFVSHQHDLMYAANIEFIVEKKSKKIRDVYARQWFKGEI